MKTGFLRITVITLSFLFAQSIAQVQHYTWMKGAPNNSLAVYGTIGVGGSGNTPGNQYEGVTWIDQLGNHWLYGGRGYNASNFTDLSDLWKYTPGTNNWTWIKGAGSASLAPVYGTLGVSSSGNTPGARSGSASWTDASGNLWLFGGMSVSGPLNDLWRYNPSNNQWTWMGGTTTASANPVYGTQTVPSTTNIPRASYNLISWKDPSGNFWLYDGLYGNEVWKFNPLTAQWAWMSGTSTGAVMSGMVVSVFGTQGVSSSSAHPGERWTSGVGDAAGNLYIFGGKVPSGTFTSRGNDLWKYNISTNQWTWISGTQLINHVGTYGTLGVFSNTSVPAGRRGGHALWVDNTNNKLWLFGGDYITLVNVYSLNDTWCYDLSTGQWAWMKGSNVPYSGNAADASAVYGTQSMASPSNTPGWRMGATYWSSDPNALWIFAGNAIGPNTELWKFSGCTIITPSVNISSSHSMVCAGNAATLTASGSVNTFSWNTGAQTNSIVVSPANTTAYSVINTGSNCMSMGAFILTVAPLPTLTVNSSSSLSCGGSSVVLTASGAGTYTWSSGQTSASLQVSPLATTVYTVTGTNNACSSIKTFTQQVQALPILSINSTSNQICRGNSVVLTASGASGYLWNTGQSSPSLSLSPLATTIYTVTGTTNGCSAIGTFTQQVLQLPTLVVSGATNVVCKGETVTLSVSGASTYTWNTNGPTSPTIQMSPTSTSVVAVTGTDNNGCMNAQTVTVNVSECVGINSFNSDASFGLYPNPSSNEFSISGGKGSVLSIVNALGQMVFEQKLELDTNILRTHLTPGIYYCTVSGSGKSVKLIVE